MSSRENTSNVSTTSEKSSVILMVTTLLSRLLGIVKARVISSCFGGGSLTDAINFSYNIPNSMRKLFAEGSLSSSYLPVFARLKDDKRETEKFFSRIITFQLLIFIPLIILAFLFGRETISLFSGFTDEWQIMIASSLLPYFMVFLVFISLSALFSALLEARGRFLAVGISPLAFSLSVILSLIFLSPSLKHYAMAVGTICGSIAQCAVVIVSLARYRLKFHISFDFKDEAFIEVMRHWAPSTITAVIAIVSQQITFYFASSLPPGSVSAFTNAIIFYQTPYGVFFASIAGVYFPLLSRTENEKERGMILSKTLSYLYTFLLPCAIAIWSLSKECISIVLQKGAFTLENTLMTASVLDWYMPSLVLLAFYSMLQRYSYSKGDYKYPLYVSLISATVDVLFTWIFIKLGDGPEAISKAYLVSNIAGILLIGLKVKDFEFKKFIKNIIKITLLNLPLFFVAVLYRLHGFDYYEAGSTLKGALFFILTGCAFILLTLLVYIAAKVPFLSALRGRK